MNTQIEQMQKRFHTLVTMLRGFGFSGEVLLKSGLVIIGAHDKHSASMIRRAFRQAKNTGEGTLTEVRSKNGAAFVWVSDEVVLSKQEIRSLAIAA